MSAEEERLTDYAFWLASELDKMDKERTALRWRIWMLNNWITAKGYDLAEVEGELQPPIPMDGERGSR